MLTLPRIIAFALFALELLAVAHATPTRAERAVSNAARFAQGLGPARPKRLYTGTRTSTLPPARPRVTQDSSRVFPRCRARGSVGRGRDDVRTVSMSIGPAAAALTADPPSPCMQADREHRVAALL